MRTHVIAATLSATLLFLLCVSPSCMSAPCRGTWGGGDAWHAFCTHCLLTHPASILYSIYFTIEQEIISQFGGSPLPPLSSWQLQALDRLGVTSSSPGSSGPASPDPAPPSPSTSTSTPQSMDTSAALAETQGSLSSLVYVRPQGEHFIDARLLAGLRIMFLGEGER